MARPKKITIDQELVEEAVAEVLAEEAAPVNNELQGLLALHKSMTEKGIKDIGQLEVLISKIQ